MSTGLYIMDNVFDFLFNTSAKLGPDVLFIIGLVVEVLFVLFFIIKSAFSYEVALNRALDKINYWLFEKKNVTEDNIRDLNNIFKTKAPKRLCYYWHQFVLFREGTPSDYFTAENLVDQPSKTSTYKSDIKNLTILTIFWAVLASTFVLVFKSQGSALTGEAVIFALLLGCVIALIGLVVVIYMGSRHKAILNSLYQNVRLFDRFMDNACLDLPSYIDYQILFTPVEIEKGQPVLREFLDFKARKEKEEFNKAREEEIDYVVYDFTETGVDGSIVLNRAMRESELFLKRRDKILVQISQLEAELESRRKNFDNIQRDSQTKIQASKENITRLRQMQEETTNRIESNYYRKQQTQEAAKQEQLEQEFDQQRAKYLLEKAECEEEIAKLNAELEEYRKNVEDAMLAEYKTFYEKFCKSAEKVVTKVFGQKLAELKDENAKNKQTITDLELKLKSVENNPQSVAEEEQQAQEGQYDENGNYVYPNGTFYDKDGNFHDNEGNIYDQEGKLISATQQEKKEEKQVVDFETFDTFDFMTDVKQKDDIYDVAENVVNELDTDKEIEIVNEKPVEEKQEETLDKQEPQLENFSLNEETDGVDSEEVEKQEEVEVEEKPAKRVGRPRKNPVENEEDKPKRKAGRPRKVVAEAEEPKRKVGRPRKNATENEEPKRRVGRPKKAETKNVEDKPKRKAGRPRKVVAEKPKTETKKKAGRPKKIVKEEAEPKRGRGRPRKTQEETIIEINKRLSEEEARLAKMREDLNKELELAMNGAEQTSSQRKRNQLMKEIESLQVEAQNAILANESEAKMQEIDEKLEKLLEEIKKLNS